MRKALVLGAGGFIGNHMVNSLKDDGYYVRAVDIKQHDFVISRADDFCIGDLCDEGVVDSAMKILGGFDEVYQFAADMGGAGYVFTGEHDADIIQNSMRINLNVARAAVTYRVGKLFYSSSACVYPAHIQEDPNSPGLRESDAYPANPDSEYGFEKLMSERLYNAYRNNYGLNVRIARFHNIFGPLGTYKGGKEKAPAAICRKVAEVEEGGQIEIWGDGEQTRSFLYIDECIFAVRRLMQSDCLLTLNIGSDIRISINDLVKMVCEISGKKNVFVKHIDGPLGVRGRNSNNDLFFEKMGFKPTMPLRTGMELTYKWILNQVKTGRELPQW